MENPIISGRSYDFYKVSDTHIGNMYSLPHGSKYFSGLLDHRLLTWDDRMVQACGCFVAQGKSQSQCASLHLAING